MELERSRRNRGRIGDWLFTSKDEIPDSLTAVELISSLLELARESKLLITNDCRAYVDCQFIATTLSEMGYLFAHRHSTTIEITGFGDEYIFKNELIETRPSDALLEIDLNACVEQKMNLTIGTRSDIWMPYTIQGKPQMNKYSANLGRLSRLLYSIEKLGFDLDKSETMEEMDHCFISGYFMQNKTDGDSSNNVYNQDVYWDELTE